MGHKYYWKCWPWDSLSTLWNSHIVFYLIKNWHKDQCSEHVQPKQVEEEGLDDIEGSGTSSKDNNEDDEDIIDKGQALHPKITMRMMRTLLICFGYF